MSNNGPIPNLRREEYLKRLTPNDKQTRRIMNRIMLDRLDACKDDESRKVLLGIRA